MARDPQTLSRFRWNLPLFSIVLAPLGIREVRHRNGRSQPPRIEFDPACPDGIIPHLLGYNPSSPTEERTDFDPEIRYASSVILLWIGRLMLLTTLLHQIRATYPRGECIKPAPADVRRGRQGITVGQQGELFKKIETQLWNQLDETTLLPAELHTWLTEWWGEYDRFFYANFPSCPDAGPFSLCAIQQLEDWTVSSPKLVEWYRQWTHTGTHTETQSCPQPQTQTRPLS